MKSSYRLSLLTELSPHYGNTVLADSGLNYLSTSLFDQNVSIAELQVAALLKGSTIQSVS